MTLTHFNKAGDAHMVDVGGKRITERMALCEGYIEMQRETLQQIVVGTHKKGDVLGVARVAGIMAAKKTAELIPLCHPLFLSHVGVELEPETDHTPCRVRCQVTVKTSSRTGVEIEALNATQVALLTIYDMCKAIDRGMTIQNVRLLEKSGGESGEWRRNKA